MAVCAVAPAREPAMNLLCVSIFSPSVDNNFLYYRKHWNCNTINVFLVFVWHQIYKMCISELTCSYAMNLIAVSGAIFKTLIPFPLQSEARPPSMIICLKPPIRLIRLVLEEWTCSRNIKASQKSFKQKPWGVSIDVFFPGDPSAKSYLNCFLHCDYDWGQPGNKVLLS